MTNKELIMQTITKIAYDNEIKKIATVPIDTSKMVRPTSSNPFSAGANNSPSIPSTTINSGARPFPTTNDASPFTSGATIAKTKSPSSSPNPGKSIASKGFNYNIYKGSNPTSFNGEVTDAHRDRIQSYRDKNWAMDATINLDALKEGGGSHSGRYYVKPEKASAELPVVELRQEEKTKKAIPNKANQTLSIGNLGGDAKNDRVDEKTISAPVFTDSDNVLSIGTLGGNNPLLEKQRSANTDTGEATYTENPFTQEGMFRAERERLRLERTLNLQKLIEDRKNGISPEQRVNNRFDSLPYNSEVTVTN